mmetsp:Transcript_2866/g.4172  ORF Transcript_2866/g.4172 Transcript_2866/m.4172 type:complete len:91 (-) Transcript_2866:3647-3919(-)
MRRLRKMIANCRPQLICRTQQNIPTDSPKVKRRNSTKTNKETDEVDECRPIPYVNIIAASTLAINRTTTERVLYAAKKGIVSARESSLSR